jgi:ribosomal-protein-alanine N-acetyltransferase
MRFTFRTIDEADVDTMLAWRYEPPYDRYDPAGEDGYRHAIGSPTWFAAVDADDGSLAGFLECRVAEREVEIGLGLRPDLTGRGIGPPFVGALVAFIGERWAPEAVTLDVFPWNERAIRAYERAGFVRGEEYERTFEDGATRIFLRMTRSLHD